MVDFGTEQLVEYYSDFVEEGLFRPEARIVEDHFTEDGARVLDLGCGTGRTTSPLADAGFDVLGADVSESMVENGHELFPNLSFCVGDASQLPFDDETFDYVLFSFNGLDYIKPERRRLEALREIRRVLRDGGKFAFSTHNSRLVLPYPSYNLSQYPKIVRFWVVNLIRGRVGSRYKIDTLAGGNETYFISPSEQRRQLRECGFTPLDVYGRRDGALAKLDLWPYYVARKPADEREEA